MIGRRIGHYELLHRLGEGGVGQVFVAIDRKLDRPVAIKALRPEHSREPGFIARFRAEAGVLARLNHPNIASIYTMEQVGTEHFMVLELVQGSTLEAVLASHGRLDEAGALALAAQALAGLSAAHRARIVHRDIKPSNLMLAPAGTAKLMDFGIARIRGSGRMTRYGHIVGTLAYMSPEQIRGEEGDARSDLYSLGIVLYETVAGRRPFNTSSEYDLIKAQIELPPPSIQDLAPGLSQRFCAAVMRCLEKDPALRFADADALARTIGVDDLSRPAEELLQLRVGTEIARAVEPLARLLDQDRRRSPQPESTPSVPAATGLTQLGPPANGPRRPAPLVTGTPVTGRGWRPLMIPAGAATLLVLGLLALIVLNRAGSDRHDPGDLPVPPPRQEDSAPLPPDASAKLPGRPDASGPLSAPATLAPQLGDTDMPGEPAAPPPGDPPSTPAVARPILPPDAVVIPTTVPAAVAEPGVRPSGTSSAKKGTQSRHKAPATTAAKAAGGNDDDLAPRTESSGSRWILKE